MHIFKNIFGFIVLGLLIILAVRTSLLFKTADTILKYANLSDCLTLNFDIVHKWR